MMEKIKLNIKCIGWKKYLPILMFALIQAVYHVLMREPEGSDAFWFFRYQLDSYTLKDYLTIRYDTWSSRFLIEGALVYVSRNLILWKMIDWAFWVFLAWAFTGLFPKELREKAGYIIAGFLLIYPMYDLKTAGWIATSVNYTWPLALGVFSLHGTANACYGKKTHPVMWVVYGLAAAFGANMEQMSAVLFAVNLFAILYCIIEKTSVRYYVSSIIGFMIASSEFVFILTCPGNAARKEQEIINWMPNFDSLNLLDKINMAFVDTMHHLIASDNLMYLCYLILLAVLVFRKTEHIGFRFVALFPVVMNVCMLTLPGMLENYFPEFYKIMEKNAFIDGTNYHLAANYLPMIIYLVLIGCMLLALTAVCESYLELFAQAALLALGLATRLVMGFTPTIYVSQERTFFFLYMVLGISAAWLLLRSLPMLQRSRKLYDSLKLAGILLTVFGLLFNLAVVGAAA